MSAHDECQPGLAAPGTTTELSIPSSNANERANVLPMDVVVVRRVDGPVVFDYDDLPAFDVLLAGHQSGWQLSP